MDSPLGPTLANSFLCYQEKRWLDKWLEEFRPVFHRWHVDNIFLLFRKENHLKLFLNYLNLSHKNVKFTSKKNPNNKLSFLDIKISRDKNQIYSKKVLQHTFPKKGIYIFLPYLRKMLLSVRSTKNYLWHSFLCQLKSSF